MRSVCFTLAALTISACGGGEAPASLTIHAAPLVAGGLATLTGRSFVPKGSDCPPSTEFVRIGTLGAHDMAYVNAETGVSGPVGADLWVCNAGDGRSIGWTSSPIRLVPGNNTITVTMRDAERSASATIVLLH